MNKIILTATLAIAAVSCTKVQGPAVVEIKNPTGQKIYFQPESSPGYTAVEPTDTVITISDTPVYYRLVSADGTFYPVYISSGSTTGINVGENGVEITGSNEKINRFLNENTYICRTPDSIKTYSREWLDYNAQTLNTLDSLIDASGFDKDFAATQKLYNRYTLFDQCITGLKLAKAFWQNGQEIETDENFYCFLDTLRFTDERILNIPKWFTVVNSVLETKENLGRLPVDNDSYMSIYANAIDNEKVRSHYLTELLQLTLKRNYLNDFSRQLPEVRTLITDPEALAMLPDLEKTFDEKSVADANVSAGTQMPEFQFNDVNGKKYDFSDFRGNYVLLDFWFTGCAPCRAEMPYFDEVAKTFAGKGVKFISLSVDTGDELYAAWEKMMRDKPHTPEVLSVNLPDGFNSPLMKQLNIHGVPRIMLIDPEGKIVESYAKRPSDPKLLQQLHTLTQQ